MMLCALAFVIASPAHATPFRLEVSDPSGKPVQVIPTAAPKGVVAFFVQALPNDRLFAPEMQRIASAYRQEGWKFYLAFTNSLYSPSNLVDYRKEHQFDFPSVMAGELQRRSNTTITPSAAVFDRNGQVLYSGRIDDRLSQETHEPKVHDLVVALSALTANHPAPHKFVPPTGDHVTYD